MIDRRLALQSGVAALMAASMATVTIASRQPATTDTTDAAEASPASTTVPDRAPTPLSGSGDDGQPTAGTTPSTLGDDPGVGDETDVDNTSDDSTAGDEGADPVDDSTAGDEGADPVDVALPASTEPATANDDDAVAPTGDTTDAGDGAGAGGATSTSAGATDAPASTSTTGGQTTTAPTAADPAPTAASADRDTTLVNSPEEVAYDMFGPARTVPVSAWTGGATDYGRPWPNHEAKIADEGLKYRWLIGGWGSKWNVPGGERAIYARCQAYPAEGGVQATGFKLQIRGLRSYERIDGEWNLHQNSDTAGLSGDWYDLADFLADTQLSGTAKLQPVSGQPGVFEVDWPANGEIFHFFMGMNDMPAGQVRKLFDPAYDPNRDAFFATTQMRLVPGANANVDLGAVRLLGDCGLDYYKNETSTRKRDYPGRPVPSSGHARSKLITSEWQAFNWYVTPGEPKQTGETRTWQELQQAIIDDPPPIEQ